MTGCEIRRSRPLLGTLVEIGAAGSKHACLKAIEAAFGAVERVQCLMSVHDPGSDVSRVNRQAHVCRVPVDPWTAEVLRFALRMRRESGGAFDCDVGSRLEYAGFLPAGTVRPGLNAAGADGLCVDTSGRVCSRRSVQLDLGGIAKGYAVDRAIETLWNSGVTSAMVNAGGDLRVFGIAEFPVLVRDPDSHGRLARVLSLQDGAVATSAGYHASARFEGKRVTPIFNPLRQRFLAPGFSVTVAAKTCMVADALTKVAAVLGPRAKPLLQAYGAHALWWRRGRIRSTWEARCAAAA